MGDEYQLRKDINRIYRELYRVESDSFDVVKRDEYFNQINEYDSQLSELMDIKLNRNDLFNLIYPVGSVYSTTNEDFDPSESFGGVWQLIDSTIVYMWERTE